MTITKIRMQRLQSKIQKTRAELIEEKPFFGILLMYLKFVAVDNIRNISTNGRCIYFNPSFIDKLSPYEMQFVLCHQLMHILNGDIWRNEGLTGDDYHRAYDIITNRQLLKMGWNASALSHLGKLQYSIPLCDYDIDELTPDDIYELLPFKLRMLDERTRNRYMADSDFWWNYKDDNGEEGVMILDLPGITIWSGKPELSKGKSAGVGETGQMKDFWEVKTHEVLNTIKSRGMRAGSIPGELLRKIRESRKSVLDWRTMLIDFIQEETTDYSFSPPDRRLIDFDFFLPDFNEKEYISRDILFMADTSGSVCREALETVYAELRGVIEQFKGKINGKLGFFDCRVTEPIPFEGISDLEKIKPYGGGGTDFRVIFEYIKNDMGHCQPSAVVIFTDGYGPFPEKSDSLGIPVMWILDNEEVTPPWGKVARVTV